MRRSFKRPNPPSCFHPPFPHKLPQRLSGLFWSSFPAISSEGLCKAPEQNQLEEGVPLHICPKQNSAIYRNRGLSLKPGLSLMFSQRAAFQWRTRTHIQIYAISLSLGQSKETSKGKGQGSIQLRCSVSKGRYGTAGLISSS